MRNAFAVSALRIGVLALRQAQGNVDAEVALRSALAHAKLHRPMALPPSNPGDFFDDAAHNFCNAYAEAHNPKHGAVGGKAYSRAVMSIYLPTPPSSSFSIFSASLRTGWGWMILMSLSARGRYTASASMQTLPATWPAVPISTICWRMSLATWLGPLRRFVLAHPLGR